MTSRRIGPERAWDTWDTDDPGCLVHLPSGFAIRLSAFSTRERRYTDFPFDSNTLRLGPHLPDGSYVELELAHAGSRLRLRFAAAEPSGVVGQVDVLETGEWGLRFWYVLEAGFIDELSPGDALVRLRIPPEEARYVEAPVAVARLRDGAAVFSTGIRPVGAHLYHERREAGQEFEEDGYYARPPNRNEGRWAIFRFNAVTPHVGFAATVSTDVETAVDELSRTMSRIDEVLAERAKRAAVEPPGRCAIRDVLAWNAVWDAVNERPYTTATRGWVTSRFGGWVVWQIDALFNALLAAHIDDFEMARANLEAALSLQTEHGNLAALASARTRWVDRSHPPIGALIVWSLFLRTGDVRLLEGSYPVLARAFDWWFEHRDGNGNGLLEYGSSPVGDGHFVHTRLAAMDESAMDNSPVHDEATFNAGSHTLDMEDVGLNSLLVLEGDLLGRIADELERVGEGARLRERSAALAERVQARLWDAERGIFANRLWDGRFARSLAPTSFYPLLAGIATTEQAEAMVRGYLLDPARFGGAYPVAGTPHEDPASADNVYWRGRVWPCFNFLVYLGLRRYRFDGAAGELADKGAAMFGRGWTERRSYENFNQRTGEGGDSPDADPFYSWGALLPLLREMELIDVDPWHGLTFGSEVLDGDEAEITTAQGRFRVEVAEGNTRILHDGRSLLEAGFRGRFRDLVVQSGGLSLEVPAVPGGGRIMVHAAVSDAELDSERLEPSATGEAGEEPTAFFIPPGSEPRRLVLSMSPQPLDGRQTR